MHLLRNLVEHGAKLLFEVQLELPFQRRDIHLCVFGESQQIDPRTLDLRMKGTRAGGEWRFEYVRNLCDRCQHPSPTARLEQPVDSQYATTQA